MNLVEVMENLQNEGNPSRRKTFLKQGAAEDTFGVPMGKIRSMAKEIGKNQEFADELWSTGQFDAQNLGIFLMEAGKVTLEDALEYLGSAQTVELADSLISNVLVNINDVAKLLDLCSKNRDLKLRRAYWALMVANKSQYEADFPEILEYISENLALSQEPETWMMNRMLCEIGFGYSNYTEKCLEIGERCGVYKTMKVSKGCTSAYAPDWIHAVVGRK